MIVTSPDEAARAQRAKAFVAVLCREPESALLDEALAQLSAFYSAVDYRSPAYPFIYTDYYKAEMGAPLQRVLLSFEALMAPEDLIECKHFTWHLEQSLSRAGRRRLNIDPAYLDFGKVVLASGKSAGHKLYLGREVWADLTLYYRHRTFHALPWSFPDFKSGVYDESLLLMRKRYKKQFSQ